MSPNTVKARGPCSIPPGYNPFDVSLHIKLKIKIMLITLFESDSYLSLLGHRGIEDNMT